MFHPRNQVQSVFSILSSTFLILFNFFNLSQKWLSQWPKQYRPGAMSSPGHNNKGRAHFILLAGSGQAYLRLRRIVVGGPGRACDGWRMGRLSCLSVTSHTPPHHHTTPHTHRSIFLLLFVLFGWYFDYFEGIWGKKLPFDLPLRWST